MNFRTLTSVKIQSVLTDSYWVSWAVAYGYVGFVGYVSDWMVIASGEICLKNWCVDQKNTGTSVAQRSMTKIFLIVR